MENHGASKTKHESRKRVTDSDSHRNSREKLPGHTTVIGCESVPHHPVPLTLPSPLKTSSTPSSTDFLSCITCTKLDDPTAKVPTPIFGSLTSDPRNGFMEPHFGLPLQFPSAFATFHAPIPVDQRTHEGRYVWDPAAVRVHPFHHPGAHGLPSSAGATPVSLPDLSFLPQPRRSNVPVTTTQTAADHPAYLLNPYMEHLYGSFHSSPSVSLRGISPVDTRGLSMHPDYLTQMAALSQRSLDVHNTHPPNTAGSTDLPFPLESSRLTSPRPSGRHGRKRALSSSPYSDSFDINSMIRFSPNSLVSIMNGSRSTSTSGSYGHLSAGTLSPALNMHPPVGAAHLQQLQHLMRQSTLPGSPFLTHGGLMHQSPGLTPQQSLLMAQAQMPTLLHSLGASKMDSGSDVVSTKDSPSNIVSSTIETSSVSSFTETKRTKIKKEPSYSMSTRASSVDDKDSNDLMKDEPGDFIETNCHWRECIKEFNTQDELVKHINNDHIHANKKSFVCRWKECQRGEKPFKAQYMLVVHMRRHTGEKPHVCSFEGCSKAYSRLENLKTHLRSHTGEKPYMCEFPGCTKAFSNASDRAKHQNRTHSNEKPYVCKAPGCTKRYTDPSSLRKHVKTVHGAEFYANKKHKGTDDSGSNPPPREDSRDSDRNPGSESSPKSEDCLAGKTASISSPSIKSEDPLSPQEHSSPSIDTNVASEPLIADDSGLDDPISDNNVSTTNGCADIVEEQEWEINDPEEVEEPEICIPISASNAVTSSGGGNNTVSVILQERNAQNRLKSRFTSKGSSTFPPLPQLPNIGGMHRNVNPGLGPPNRRMTELKGNSNSMTSAQRKLIDLNLSPNQTHRQTTVPLTSQGYRRDSTTSTISSFYSSMRSDASPHTFGSQMSSRRGSEASQSSARVPMAPSPYDPISLGSSRRSSEASINMQGITASMAAHLQRLHWRAIATQEMGSTQNLVVQTQNMSLSSTGQQSNHSWVGPDGRYTSLSCHTPQTHEAANREVRRASDPVRWPECNYRAGEEVKGREGQSNNNTNKSLTSRQPTLPSIEKSSPSRTGTSIGDSSRDSMSEGRHPNEDVVLDECEEDQMVEENKDLVLPDEMVHYLNQVADKCGKDGEGDGSIVSDVAQLSPNPCSDGGQQCPNSHHHHHNNNNSQDPPSQGHHHHSPQTNVTQNQQLRSATSTPKGHNSSQVKKNPQLNFAINEPAMPYIQQQHVIGYGPMTQSMVYSQNYNQMLQQQQGNCVVDMNYQQFQNNSSPMPNQRILANQQCHNNVMWMQQQVNNMMTSPMNSDGMMNGMMNCGNVNHSRNFENVPMMSPNHNGSSGNGNFNCNSFAMNPAMMGGQGCHVNSTCSNCQQHVPAQLQSMNQGMGCTMSMAVPSPQQMAVNTGPGFMPSRASTPQQHQRMSDRQGQMNEGGMFRRSIAGGNVECMHSSVQMLPSMGRQRETFQNCNCNGSQVFQSMNSPMPSSPQSRVVVVTSPHCQNCSNCKKPEIQCQDISQSTLPPIATKVPAGGHRRTCMGMRPDAYQRTLEYVQQCQQKWNVPSPKSDDGASVKCRDVSSVKGMMKNKSGRRSMSLEMSPGCNKVTSTTDNSEFLSAPCSLIEARVCKKPLAADERPRTPKLMTSSGNGSHGMANLVVSRNSALSSVNEGKSGGDFAGLGTKNSNMVINDMNSTLTSLMEETKFLQMLY